MNPPDPVALVSAFKTAPTLDPQTLAAATAAGNGSTADAVGNTQATAAFATAVTQVNNVSRLSPVLQTHVWNSQSQATQNQWRQAGYNPPDITSPNNSPSLMGTLAHDIGGAASAVGHQLSTGASDVMGVLGAPLRFVQHLTRAANVHAEMGMQEQGISPNQIATEAQSGGVQGAGGWLQGLGHLFNMHDWATAWRETSNGEKSFDPYIAQKIANSTDPLRFSLAKQMASIPAGQDPGATENAIVNAYPVAQRQQIVTMLHSDPEVKSLVTQLQDAKLSLGRELVGQQNLVKHPGLNRLAGGIDATYDILGDPTMQVGKGMKVYEAARWGLDASRVAALGAGTTSDYQTFIRNLATNDSGVQRLFGQIAHIANTDGWGAVGRVMKQVDPLVSDLAQAHGDNPATIESIAKVFGDEAGVKAIVTGQAAKIGDAGTVIFPHLSPIGQAKVFANWKFQKAIDFLAEADRFDKPKVEQQLGREAGGAEGAPGVAFTPPKSTSLPLTPEEKSSLDNLGLTDQARTSARSALNPDTNPDYARLYLDLRQAEVDGKTLTAQQMAFLNGGIEDIPRYVADGFANKPVTFIDENGAKVRFGEPHEDGSVLTKDDLSGDDPQLLADEQSGKLRSTAKLDLAPQRNVMQRMLMNRGVTGLARTFKQLTTLTTEKPFIDFLDPNSVTQIRRMLQPFMPTWAVDKITDAYAKAGAEGTDAFTVSQRFQIYKGAVAQMMHFAGIDSVSDGHTVAKNILDTLEQSMHGETYAPLGLDKMADGERQIRAAVLDSQTNARAWMPSFKEMHAAIMQDAFLHSVRVPAINAEERFMNLWRAGVLFRPGFPMRVAIDENLGNMLRQGVIDTLVGHWGGHLARKYNKAAEKEVANTVQEAVDKAREAEQGLNPADVNMFRAIRAMTTDTPKEILGQVKTSADLAAATVGERTWRALGKLPFGKGLDRADVHFAARMAQTYLHDGVAGTISALHGESGGGLDIGQEVMKWVNQNGKAEFFRFKLGRSYNSVDTADDFYRQKWYHTLGTISRSKIGQEVLRGLTEDIGHNALVARVMKLLQDPEFANEKALMLRAHQDAEGARVGDGAFDISQDRADRQLANKAIRMVQSHVTSGEIPMRTQKGSVVPNWAEFDRTYKPRLIRGLVATLRDGELNPDILREIPHQDLPQHIIGPDIIPVSPVDNWLERGFQGLGRMIDTLSRQPLYISALARAMKDLRAHVEAMNPLRDLSLRDNEVLLNRVHQAERADQTLNPGAYSGHYIEAADRPGGWHFSLGHEPNYDVMDNAFGNLRTHASHFAGRMDDGTLKLDQKRDGMKSEVGSSAALEKLNPRLYNEVHEWALEAQREGTPEAYDALDAKRRAYLHENHIPFTEHAAISDQNFREILGAHEARLKGYHSIYYKSVGGNEEYVALKDEAVRHLRSFDNPEHLQGLKEARADVSPHKWDPYNLADDWMEAHGYKVPHSYDPTEHLDDKGEEVGDFMTIARLEREHPEEYAKLDSWLEKQLQDSDHPAPSNRWAEEAAKLRAPTEEEIAAHQARNEELLTHLAARRAMNDIKPYLHSPEIRSQFEVMHRTAMPFLFAQDQFLKRWGKTFLTDPTTIAKAQLGMNGLRTSGIIHKDENGEDIFSYPGSAYVTDFIARTANAIGIPASIPLSVGFTGQVKYLMPGIANPLTPSVGPTVAIPLKQLANWMPELNGITQGLLGPGASTTMWQQILPTSLSRLYLAVTGDPNSTGEFASAMMKAMQDLQAQGHGLPADATTAQKQQYLDRLTNWTRILFFTKAMLGFTAPASPTEKFDPQNLNLRLATLLNELPYDQAISQFLKEQPDATPYTVFASQSDGGANLPATAAAGQFINSNSTFIQDYPQASGWFIPRTTGTAPFDPATYRTQIQYGMRTDKLPTQFLQDITIAPAAKAYYAAYDKEQAALLAAGNDTAAKQAIRSTFDQEKTAFLAQNPTFADSLNSSTTKSRRESTIQELQQALLDPNLPQGAQTDHIREMMTAFDSYMQDYDTLVGQSSSSASAAKRAMQETFLSEGAAYAAANPDISDMWTNLLKPEVTDTTSGIAATPAASTLLGQTPVAPPATPAFPAYVAQQGVA